MSRYISRGLYLVLFTGGLTLLGAGIANAADTTGEDGVLSGTQVVAPISAPVSVTGNAISVLGDVVSGGSAAPAAAPAPAPGPVTTSGSDSLLGGTQAVVSAVVPVNVGGNALSVLGDSAAAPAAAPAAAAAAPAAAPTTSGSDGIAGGTQVLPDVAIPVTVGGNAISLLGDSSSEGSSTAAAPTATAAGDGATTSGGDSVAGGSQVAPDVAVPVNVGGNAISVLGDSSSEGSSTAAAPAATTAGDGATTSGGDSVAGGSQVAPVVTAPVTVGGNAISVAGDSSSTGSSTTAGSPSATGTGASTSGSDGIAGGTQVLPDVAVPVNVGGNAISILGDAESTDSTTSTATEGTSDDVVTTGDSGVLGGTQIAPVIALPITLGGNAISVTGDSETTGTSAIPTPVDPTDPVTPTDPTDPTGPVTPTDPTDGTDPDGTAGVDGFPGDVDPDGTTIATTGSFGLGVSAIAALDAAQLASTGTTIAPALALVVLLIAAGLGLALAGRRRTN